MKKTAVTVAALCALAASSGARADDATFTGFAHGSETVNYNVPGQTVPADHVTGAASAGGFSTLFGGQSFTSYCVDLYQHIAFNVTYHDYGSVGGTHVFANSSAYADLGRLFATAGAIADAAHEAAFQMAVWEIAYETGGGYSLTGGTATFAGSSEANGYATTWLSQLGNHGSGPTLNVLESAGQQDVIYAPVPEPSEIALMLTGLVAIAGVARRRKKGRAA